MFIIENNFECCALVSVAVSMNPTITPPKKRTKIDGKKKKAPRPIVTKRQKSPSSSVLCL